MKIINMIIRIIKLLFTKPRKKTGAQRIQEVTATFQNMIDEVQLGVNDLYTEIDNLGSKIIRLQDKKDDRIDQREKGAILLRKLTEIIDG